MALPVDETTFEQEVLNSSVPVLVNFWAPWCGLCRLMSPLLSQIQAEYPGQVKLVSVNADENLRLANTYRLTTLPTVILFEDGKLRHRMDNFRSHDDLRAVSSTLLGRLEQPTLSLR